MSSRVTLLLKNRKFQLCLGIVIVIILLGVIGPFFTRDPFKIAGRVYEPPSSQFLLGTDMAGRDVFAQLCNAIRDSLIVGFIAGFSAVGIAILIGAVLVYEGGVVDEGANVITNVFLVLPELIILIVIASLLGKRSLIIVAILIALFNWAWMARSIRSQILSLKERKFVDLSRISGRSNFIIVIKEILPNMLAYIFLVLIIGISSAVVIESGISVIGLGPTEGFTLGKMLELVISHEAAQQGKWWYFIPPGLILVIFTGSLIMITAVIDDVLNPRTREI
jgi:peptide/nickel transport system permease protein